MLFQDVEITTPNNPQGEKTNRGSIAWCPIEIDGQPTDIEVIIAMPEHLALFVKNGQDSLAREFKMSVPVQWNGKAPRTRARGMDNVDVLLVQDDGSFVDVQVSVVTRDKKFYVCAQQIFKGWALYKTLYRPDGTQEIGFVPTDAIHNYPGMDFALSFPGIANALRPYAEEVGTDFEAYPPTPWNPPTVAKNNDAESGVVTFFNGVTGMGFIQRKDGAQIFVHFSDIVGGGDGTIDFPILLPMKGVHFDTKAQDGGKTKAVNVSPAD